MARINVRAFREFFRSKSAGGIILLFCVAVSLIIANSPLQNAFSSLLHREIGFSSNDVELRYSLETWINDGLMAIFFLLIGLEIKRELVEGELSSPRKAALPIFAAFGGAIVPAIIFFLLNKGTLTAAGWGIPMATDIAFALAVISLLGDRVPPSLKIFLAALAIVDDLIAILVIALFYSSGLNLINLSLAVGITAILFTLNRIGVRRLWCYILPGLLVWYFIHHSGVHATIAGVLVAFTLPTNKTDVPSPLEKLEHYLNKPVNFLVMPLFAIANTNISFENASAEMITGTLGMGIIAGLLLGKPVGILLSSWLTVRLGLGNLPAGARWPHILGIGILGGIGFTMSIFISLLSFADPLLQDASKFAVMLASSAAGICGYLFLNVIRRPAHPRGHKSLYL